MSLADRRRGEADLELMDNNVLLFGRWYRRLGVDAPPQLSHLKSFVMDRKAYWGDEIALRVFAGALKVVLIVVLQAEERLQCVFPPNGGASGICYLVLTHRGNVPHYRGVSVTGKHYLKLDHSDNTDPTGNAYITVRIVCETRSRALRYSHALSLRCYPLTTTRVPSRLGVVHILPGHSVCHDTNFGLAGSVLTGCVLLSTRRAGWLGACWRTVLRDGRST